ncbi:MAG: MFS transporter [Clostridiales bacterium]|jgi:PPP family 3-phenylpropionic acid transporter|nr:MFS transporter [Clostridiales bacterium]
MAKKTFPVYLLLLYIVFYSAQAIYGSYLSLYLDGIGFSKTQIGLLTSVSTLAILLSQPAWGYASDRARNRNHVLMLLFAAACLLILGFYLGTGLIYVLLLASVFSVFYNPISPLMDSLALETLQGGPRKFDFGQIRLGGTVGYAVGVLAAGQLMSNSYQKMFYMMSALFLAGLATMKFLPPTGDARRQARHSFRALLRDKKILCFIFMSLIFSLGLTIYYGYYPLYFASIGGNSALVGALMFATAISEIPFWFIAGKLLKRFGYGRMMILSACVAGFRWLALFFITSPILAILANMTHGFSFVTINYSIVTYIDGNIPSDLRATGQTMNNLIATIFSRVIGGALVGFLSDAFGIDRILLLSCGITFAGALVFFFWHRAIKDPVPGKAA